MRVVRGSNNIAIETMASYLSFDAAVRHNLVEEGEEMIAM